MKVNELSRDEESYIHRPTERMLNMNAGSMPAPLNPAPPEPRSATELELSMAAIDMFTETDPLKRMVWYSFRWERDARLYLDRALLAEAELAALPVRRTTP